MKMLIVLFLSLSSLTFSYTETAPQVPKIAATKASSTITPKEALNKLMEGNIRYTEDHPLHADSGKERREATKSSQTPFAVILGCSDSRVAPEILFDQGVGDLFVIRVAGNVAGSAELDSIAYAIKNLGSSVVMVLGHKNCGAIKATMDGQLTEADALGALIKPALKNCSELKNCIEANIEHVVQQITKSTLIGPHIANGEISIVGAYYDLGTGKVKLLN